MHWLNAGLILLVFALAFSIDRATSRSFHIAIMQLHRFFIRLPTGAASGRFGACISSLSLTGVGPGTARHPLRIFVLLRALNGLLSYASASEAHVRAPFYEFVKYWQTLSHGGT